MNDQKIWECIAGVRGFKSPSNSPVATLNHFLGLSVPRKLPDNPITAVNRHLGVFVPQTSKKETMTKIDPMQNSAKAISLHDTNATVDALRLELTKVNERLDALTVSLVDQAKAHNERLMFLENNHSGRSAARREDRRDRSRDGRYDGRRYERDERSNLYESRYPRRRNDGDRYLDDALDYFLDGKDDVSRTVRQKLRDEITARIKSVVNAAAPFREESILILDPVLNSRLIDSLASTLKNYRNSINSEKNEEYMRLVEYIGEDYRFIEAHLRAFGVYPSEETKYLYNSTTGKFGRTLKDKLKTVIDDSDIIRLYVKNPSTENEVSQTYCLAEVPLAKVCYE